MAVHGKGYTNQYLEGKFIPRLIIVTIKNVSIYIYIKK